MLRCICIKIVTGRRENAYNINALNILFKFILLISIVLCWGENKKKSCLSHSKTTVQLRFKLTH